MKMRSQFVCQQCGAVYAKWMGQCTNCQAWNSLVEQVAPDANSSGRSAVAKGQVSGKKIRFCED